MARMEEALVARLAQSPFVAPLLPVGVAGAKTVSWFERQRPDPGVAQSPDCITLDMISPGREYDHDGWDGLDEPRIQINCYAATSLGVLALRDAVRKEMEQSVTINGVWFEHAFVDGQGYQPPDEEDGGKRVYRVFQDVLFHFKEI